jgi:hypothetical protein
LNTSFIVLQPRQQVARAVGAVVGQPADVREVVLRGESNTRLKCLSFCAFWYCVPTVLFHQLNVLLVEAKSLKVSRAASARENAGPTSRSMADSSASPALSMSPRPPSSRSSRCSSRNVSSAD